jgi:hypothetical protein
MSARVQQVAEFYHAENKDTILNWIDSPHIQYQRGVRRVLELRIIFVAVEDERDFEDLIDKLIKTPGTVRHLCARNIKCSTRLVKKIATLLTANSTLAFLTIWLDKEDVISHKRLAFAFTKNTTLEELQLYQDEEYTNINIVNLFYGAIARRTTPDVYKVYLGKRELFSERLDVLHSRSLPEMFAKSTSDVIEMNMSPFVVIGARTGAAIAQQIIKNTHQGFLLRGGKINMDGITQIACAMRRTKSVTILRLNVAPDISRAERAQIEALFETAFTKNPFLGRGSRWYLFDDKTNFFAQMLRKHPMSIDMPLELPD